MLPLPYELLKSGYNPTYMLVLCNIMYHFADYTSNMIRPINFSNLAKICHTSRWQIHKVLNDLKINHLIITVDSKDYINPLYMCKCSLQTRLQLIGNLGIDPENSKWLIKDREESGNLSQTPTPIETIRFNMSKVKPVEPINDLPNSPKKNKSSKLIVSNNGELKKKSKVDSKDYEKQVKEARKSLKVYTPEQYFAKAFEERRMTLMEYIQKVMKNSPDQYPEEVCKKFFLHISMKQEDGLMLFERETVRLQRSYPIVLMLQKWVKSEFNKPEQNIDESTLTPEQLEYNRRLNMNVTPGMPQWMKEKIRNQNKEII
jgi:hypothetical protein